MLFGKNWEFTGADDRDDAMEQYGRQKVIKAQMVQMIWGSKYRRQLQ